MISKFITMVFGVLFKPRRSPPLRRCKGSAPAPALPPSPVVAVPSATPRDPADGLRQQERSRRQPRVASPLSSARRRPVTFTQVSPATHDARLRWKAPPLFQLVAHPGVGGCHFAHSIYYEMYNRNLLKGVVIFSATFSAPTLMYVWCSMGTVYLFHMDGN